MIRLWMAMCFAPVLLLWGCGGAVEETVTTQTFQRHAFEAKAFKGSIGGQEVSAVLSCGMDRLSGTLRFEESGLERQLDTRMSYEGLVRGEAVLANATVEGHFKAGVAKVKAVMLTDGGLTGTYQNSLSPAPVYLLLQSGQDSLVEVQSDPQADSTTWGHWMRVTHCIKGGTDTTATIALRIPRITGPQAPDVLLALYTQSVFAIAYQSKCTCQSLEKKGVQQLQVDFAVVDATTETTKIVFTASADNLPYFQHSLTFDAHTGEALRPGQSSPLP